MTDGTTSTRIAWLTLIVSIAVIAIRVVVISVQTQRDVEQLKAEMVVLREEIRIIHADVKHVLEKP